MSTAADVATAPRRARRTGSGRLKVLVVLPLTVLVIGALWAWWRATADLDEIEARTLAWDQVVTLTRQHVVLTLVSALAVVVIAVPLGVLLTRPGLRRLAPAAIVVANIGQAAPSVGLLVLGAIWLGFEPTTAVVVLTLYAILPVLQNTITGLLGVERTLVEAARGMGMSRGATLLRVELPLALPVIMTGVRTALVLLVGTATLATFINAGGLGQLIQTGINLFRYPVLVSGALLVALLALLIDWAGRVLETLARPKGL